MVPFFFNFLSLILITGRLLQVFFGGCLWYMNEVKILTAFYSVLGDLQVRCSYRGCSAWWSSETYKRDPASWNSTKLDWTA